jgi:hypothetical protein
LEEFCRSSSSVGGFVVKVVCRTGFGLWFRTTVNWIQLTTGYTDWIQLQSNSKFFELGLQILMENFKN